MADLTTKQVLQKLGKDILNWVKTNCVDNLVSTSKNLPLSANQGRVLKEGQDAINQSLDVNEIKISKGYTGAYVSREQNLKDSLIDYLNGVPKEGSCSASIKRKSGAIIYVCGYKNSAGTFYGFCVTEDVKWCSVSYSGGVITLKDIAFK